MFQYHAIHRFFNRDVIYLVYGIDDTIAVENFFLAALEMLERHPSVERYAWYPWNTHNHLTENGELTRLGELFAAAPTYRPY